MQQAYVLSLLLAAVLIIAAPPLTFAASCGHSGNDIRAFGTRRVSCGLARSVAVSWASKYRNDPAHRQPIRVTKRVPHQDDTITWSCGHQSTLPPESTVAVRCRTSHTLIAFTYVP
jgi:hypothetical protein